METNAILTSFHLKIGKFHGLANYIGFNHKDCNFALRLIFFKHGSAELVADSLSFDHFCYLSLSKFRPKSV